MLYVSLRAYLLAKSPAAEQHRGGGMVRYPSLSVGHV